MPKNFGHNTKKFFENPNKEFNRWGATVANATTDAQETVRDTAALNNSRVENVIKLAAKFNVSFDGSSFDAKFPHPLNPLNQSEQIKASWGAKNAGHGTENEQKFDQLEYALKATHAIWQANHGTNAWSQWHDNFIKLNPGGIAIFSSIVNNYKGNDISGIDGCIDASAPSLAYPKIYQGVATKELFAKYPTTKFSSSKLFSKVSEVEQVIPSEKAPVTSQEIIAQPKEMQLTKKPLSKLEEAAKKANNANPRVIEAKKLADKFNISYDDESFNPNPLEENSKIKFSWARVFDDPKHGEAFEQLEHALKAIDALQQFKQGTSTWQQQWGDSTSVLSPEGKAIFSSIMANYKGNALGVTGDYNTIASQMLSKRVDANNNNLTDDDKAKLSLTDNKKIESSKINLTDEEKVLAEASMMLVMLNSKISENVLSLITDQNHREFIDRIIAYQLIKEGKEGAAEFKIAREKALYAPYEISSHYANYLTFSPEKLEQEAALLGE